MGGEDVFDLIAQGYGWFGPNFVSSFFLFFPPPLMRYIATKWKHGNTHQITDAARSHRPRRHAVNFAIRIHPIPKSCGDHLPSNGISTSITRIRVWIQATFRRPYQESGRQYIRVTHSNIARFYFAT